MSLRKRELDGVVPQEANAEDCDGKVKDCHEGCKGHAEKPGGRGISPFDRFIQSPLWRCCTMTIVSATPVFGCIVAFPKLLEKIEITSMWAVCLHYILAFWLATQFVYNFVATQWSDAGGTKSVKPDKEATGQFEMACSGEYEDAKLLYAPNWCTKCSHWKPPRSHHCRMSGRCVLRMDHFCPFTGNCIGLKNHGHFLLFYFFAIIGLCYSAVLCILALSATAHLSNWRELIQPLIPEHMMSFDRHLLAGLVSLKTSIITQVVKNKGIEILIQSVCTTIALIFVLAMGLPAWSLAMNNTTTMERLFPMKEYVEIKEQVFCPLGPGFYSQGWKQNIKDVLGPRWWVRLLIPSRGGGPELQIGVKPRPSIAGEKALCERVLQVRENGVEKHVNSCEELGFNPGPDAKNAAGTV